MPPKSLLSLQKVANSTAEKTIQVVQKNDLAEKTKSIPTVNEHPKKVAYSHSIKRKEINKRTSSTSIYKMKDDIVKKSLNKKEEVDFSDKPRDVFNNELLLEKWNMYAEMLNENGRQGMYATLTKYQPILGENYTVSFEIDSEVQRLELQEESPEILNHLRTELNNYGIKLVYKVIKSDKSTKKHLNSKEIFLKMADSNTDLKHLRDKFNLDIEY